MYKSEPGGISATEFAIMNNELNAVGFVLYSVIFAVLFPFFLYFSDLYSSYASFVVVVVFKDRLPDLKIIKLKNITYFIP